MITELSPAFVNLTTMVKPEDFLLQNGSWIRFSPKWTAARSSGWYVDQKCYPDGMVFQVVEQPVIVPFATTKIIPGSDTVDSGDYVDLILGNTTDYSDNDDWVNIYPQKEYVVYQIGVGMKQGHYMIHTYIPAAGQYIYDLGNSNMYPDVSDTTKIYLGPKYPGDSPYDSPLWFFYAVANMPNIVLRVLAMSGVDFEKCTIGWWINKCKVELIETPSQAQKNSALYLPWYTEMKDF